ncbi:hypothetical protein [uncultured Microbacterium sp.]|uniref:hypothetical protein n=1 Tax=uncultured Microbacterium sp. TaxID=191216 RepID=UPI0025F4B8A6|nr:hypothetical protein [uncultured Microbacterium sp.]
MGTLDVDPEFSRVVCVEEHENVMDAYVARAVDKVLNERPHVEIRFTSAIHPECHFESPTALYLHPDHRELVVGIRKTHTPT